MRVYIDIETLPAIHWTPAQLETYLRRKVPKTHKKEDTIQKWISEEGDQAFADTALDWKYGNLYCVCGIIELPKKEPQYFEIVNPDPNTLEGQSAALGNLLDVLTVEDERGYRARPTFVGWNSDHFDLPFLYYKAYQSAVSELAKRIVPNPLKKYERPWIDLMKVWTLDAWKEYAKQADTAEWLGVAEDMPEFDGSMVYDAWKKGEAYKIVQHCKSDIWALKRIGDILL